MPGRKLTSVAWDDLPGKWLAISTEAGGSLGLILRSHIPFSQLVVCPLVLKNHQGVSVFRVDRVMSIGDMKSNAYEVYDTVEDMRDDVMVALLAKDGLDRPSVALIAALPEYRSIIGIDDWISKPTQVRGYSVNSLLQRNHKI